ncbi:glycine rich protein [Clostridioides difficile]|uniref:glycine rich domain-containing protein n=1 Tax=Clostridioides difficile TaxID=1496 RepID=UPI00102768EC|nr:glycine rich domain-containing protein [Clostridioides difficile]VFC53514.1 glycine rich protein [Clostridioides difficile]VHX67843.1 glycine rich protein [Clostridioides difficile]
MQTEWNFKDANIEQNITLKPGKYKFECWGARGGAYGTPYESGFYYGYGGYSCGELVLKKETTLYLYVGKDGRKGYSFNGGGYATASSGGGATDIRLIGGSWDNEQSLLSRIIVAGGGGGCYDAYDGGGGGGLKGGIGRGWNGRPTFGGTQYEGGRSIPDDGSCDGLFGKGATPSKPSPYTGGGGGWYGGACADSSKYGSGGGSGYVLTKDSYKPPGYTPTSEYYFDNVVMTTAGNTTVVGDYSDGRAKITLLQALPFLNISSYNSTQATFKADHTDPTLLTKIEYFIDDVLKETITTDLTLEKTINYTLEDNALHTLKIVVTDSNNATAEKVLSISKNIMPLPENVNLQDISTKLTEINTGFKTGKTSIINTLALKNIDASLNNTLVELSEKIKTGFDSGDASLQDLMNQLTQANNTISQLNTKYKVASGRTSALTDATSTAYLYVNSQSNPNYPINPGGWINIEGLNFIPNIFFAECECTANSPTQFYKYLIFATYSIPSLSDKDFVITTALRKTNSDTKFTADGQVYINNRGNTYINNQGVYVPAYRPYVSYTLYNWYAIKFI